MAAALLILAAAIGSAAYGLLANLPVRLLLPAGLLGAAAEGVVLAAAGMGAHTAEELFLSAFVVAVLAELLVRWLKVPVVALLVPGIMPLVPGTEVYETMLALVNREYSLAAAALVRVWLLASAIALGVAPVTAAARSLRMRRLRQRAGESREGPER